MSSEAVMMPPENEETKTMTYASKHYSGTVFHSGDAGPDGFSWAFDKEDGTEWSPPRALLHTDQLTIHLDSSFFSLGTDEYPARFFRVMVYDNDDSSGTDQRGKERNVWTREVSGDWSCYTYSNEDGWRAAQSHIRITSPNKSDQTLVITSEETDSEDKVWICPTVVAGDDPVNAPIGRTPPFYHPDPELILKKNTDD